MRRPRVYAEYLPWERLKRPEVLGPLRDRGVEIALAAQPRDADKLPRLLDDLGDLHVILWPLLDDTDGRWPSLSNFEKFRRYMDRLVQVAQDRRCSVLLDLEPPIDATRALLRFKPGPLRHIRQRSRPALLRWQRYIRELSTAEVSLEAVVPIPLVWGDPWPELLVTPPTDLGFNAVEVMGYSSLMEGYGRGLITRATARDLTRRLATEASARGWRLSVGLSGGGALGDERAMRGVHELVEDVAIAKAAGVEGLSLHSLEGALDRGPYEQWLDALCHGDSPKWERPTLRASLLWYGGLGLGRILKRFV